jgi:chromate transporter
MLLRLWAAIGLQSFGGGASTQLLIRRAFVERGGWSDDEEFPRFWILCQFAPGINLLALTTLIGRKLGGTWGIVASLAGLLVPSAGITALLTAGYAAVQGNAAMHAVVRGVVPATAGIMAVVALGFSRPLIWRAQREGARALILSAVLVAAGALALMYLQVPTLLVLAVMAVLGALLFTPRGQVSAVD